MRIKKFFASLLAGVAVVAAFSIGFYGVVTFVIPLARGDVRGAMQSRMADETEVLLNGAADAYEDEELDVSIRVLELALEKLINRSGEYQPGDRWKMERIYFLLGKSYHKNEQLDKAIEAYENTLRLNPDHLAAKYNLEMIQLQGGGGGAGNQQPTDGKKQPKI